MDIQKVIELLEKIKEKNPKMFEEVMNHFKSQENPETKPAEGTPAEEAAESPAEEKAEQAAGEGDKEDM
jgi:polyhydroxyalkanoate synthesis regulator protein